MSKKNKVHKLNRWSLARQTAVVLSAVGAVVLWLNRDTGADLKLFCNDIDKGSKYEEVLFSAQSRGFSTPFYAQEDNRITIFNKPGMLFEHGCTVDFVASQVVKTIYFEK